MIAEGRRRKLAIPSDPRTATRWYRLLPQAQREEMRRQWRADHERGRELRRGVRRGLLGETLVTVAVFAGAEFAFPRSTPTTVLLAALLGAVLGATLSKLGSDRLVSGVAGLGACFAFQWWTRSTLSLMHFYAFTLVAFACVCQGVRREERGAE